jgi:hypothetical protein
MLINSHKMIDNKEYLHYVIIFKKNKTLSRSNFKNLEVKM